MINNPSDRIVGVYDINIDTVGNLHNIANEQKNFRFVSTAKIRKSRDIKVLLGRLNQYELLNTLLKFKFIFPHNLRFSRYSYGFLGEAYEKALAHEILYDKKEKIRELNKLYEEIKIRLDRYLKEKIEYYKNREIVSAISEFVKLLKEKINILCKHNSKDFNFSSIYNLYLIYLFTFRLLGFGEFSQDKEHWLIPKQYFMVSKFLCTNTPFPLFHFKNIRKKTYQPLAGIKDSNILFLISTDIFIETENNINIYEIKTTFRKNNFRESLLKGIYQLLLFGGLLKLITSKEIKAFLLSPTTYPNYIYLPIHEIFKDNRQFDHIKKEIVYAVYKHKEKFNLL